MQALVAKSAKTIGLKVATPRLRNLGLATPAQF